MKTCCWIKIWTSICLSLVNGVSTLCLADDESLVIGLRLKQTFSVEIKGDNPPCEIYGLSFSPGGSQIAVGSENTYATLISSESGEVKTIIGTCKRGNLSPAHSPDGRYLALASGASSAGVQLWDLSTKTLKATFDGIGSAKISPDGKSIATGGEPVRIYDIATEKLLAELEAWDGTDVMDTALYDPAGNSFSFSSDSKTLAVHTDFFDEELPVINRMQLWDLEKQCLKGFFPGGPSYYLRGDKLAYVSNRLSNRAGQIHLIDPKSYRRKVLALTRGVTSFAISPDGTKLVAIEGSNLSAWVVDERRIWRLRHSVTTPSKVLPEHMRDFTCVAFSPNSEQLATGGRDGRVRIWSLQP